MVTYLIVFTSHLNKTLKYNPRLPQFAFIYETSLKKSVENIKVNIISLVIFLSEYNDYSICFITTIAILKIETTLFRMKVKNLNINVSHYFCE